MSDLSLSQLAEKAGQAAGLLKSLSNEKRLLILCHLISAGEMSVGALVEAVGLSQSALSQHLARLRGDGLVTFRREAQTLHYRIANPDTGRVIAVLRDIYCPELGSGGGERHALP
jgi:ArsR family transcriptional regulator, virulence genes transcriptional regulator